MIKSAILIKTLQRLEKGTNLGPWSDVAFVRMFSHSLYAILFI